ncbi:MAG: sulfatase-like hydrolase/transferase [Verrucomicrobiota bacterium]
MNFIVFFTDQQRWDTLGLNGNPMGLTPHFDRLARQGTFFRQAYTPQPVCGPARSCIQTGQYASTTRVWQNGPGLLPESPKLGELFKEAGYRTSYLGKWHLSPDGPGDPVKKEYRAGWDEWIGANCTELTSTPYRLRMFDENDQPVEFPGYRSDALTDLAIDYVHARAREPEQPYFLFMSFLEPHHQNSDDSYPAPHGMENTYRGGWYPPDLQAYGGSGPRDWAGYCAMIKRLDDGLGRLMDAVESSGQADNTVVVFMSDHGCHFKTRNGEYKRTPHEVSARVPLAIWGPKWNGGGQLDCPASLVDLAPSLLDTAGLPIPEAMEGHSLLPATRGETGHLPENSFIQFGDNIAIPGRAIRHGKWKYAVSASPEYHGKETAPVYTESHLYNLETDPYELFNLVNRRGYEDVRDDLRGHLLARMAGLGEAEPEIRPHPKDEPPPV